MHLRTGYFISYPKSNFEIIDGISMIGIIQPHLLHNAFRTASWTVMYLKNIAFFIVRKSLHEATQQIVTPTCMFLSNLLVGDKTLGNFIIILIFCEHTSNNAKRYILATVETSKDVPLIKVTLFYFLEKDLENSIKKLQIEFP